MEKNCKQDWGKTKVEGLPYGIGDRVRVVNSVFHNGMTGTVVDFVFALFDEINVLVELDEKPALEFAHEGGLWESAITKEKFTKCAENRGFYFDPKHLKPLATPKTQAKSDKRKVTIKRERTTKRTTQEDRVLAYLKEHGSITSWEAIQEFGATRLSAIIYDLRHEGYDIESKNETKTNRYGDKVTYTRYFLNEGNEYDED